MFFLALSIVCFAASISSELILFGSLTPLMSPPTWMMSTPSVKNPMRPL